MNVKAYSSTVVSKCTFLVILYLLRFNSSSWKVNFMASDRFRPPINQITDDRSEIYLASFETRKFQEWATFPAGRSVTADLNRFVDLNPSDNISRRTHTQIKSGKSDFPGIILCWVMHSFASQPPKTQISLIFFSPWDGIKTKRGEKRKKKTAK